MGWLCGGLDSDDVLKEMEDHKHQAGVRRRKVHCAGPDLADAPVRVARQLKEQELEVCLNGDVQTAATDDRWSSTGVRLPSGGILYL